MKNKPHNLNSDKIEVKDTKKISANRSIVKTNDWKMKYDSDEVLLIAKSLIINVREKLLQPQIAWQISNLLSSGYSILGTLGNFSLIIGKAKSRKSFFINIAVSAAVSSDLLLERFKGELPEEQNEVLYFDTEQSKYHVQLALKRICKQINIDEPNNLHVYHLRSKSPLERLEIIEALIYANDKVGFVVIDGIKDLITSINDESEATMIASKLLKWTEEKNIHIVNVLHQNKSNDNARGHIGTELINKAETVLSVSKSACGNFSVVEPQQCRNIEPEPFAFEIIDGLPILVENFESKVRSKRSNSDINDLDDSLKYQLLKEVFLINECFFYGKLISQLRLSYEKQFYKTVGKNKTIDFITYCKNKKWLLQDEPKKPYTLGDFL